MIGELSIPIFLFLEIYIYFFFVGILVCFQS